VWHPEVGRKPVLVEARVGAHAVNSGEEHLTRTVLPLIGTVRYLREHAHGVLPNGLVQQISQEMFGGVRLVPAYLDDDFNVVLEAERGEVIEVYPGTWMLKTWKEYTDMFWRGSR